MCPRAPLSCLDWCCAGVIICLCHWFCWEVRIMLFPTLRYIKHYNAYVRALQDSVDGVDEDPQDQFEWVKSNTSIYESELVWKKVSVFLFWTSRISFQLYDPPSSSPSLGPRKAPPERHPVGPCQAYPLGHERASPLGTGRAFPLWLGRTLLVRLGRSSPLGPEGNSPLGPGMAPPLGPGMADPVGPGMASPLGP